MKPQVLFVDDEPFILNGLRRMLRRYKDRTEMAFAGSGAEALELLAEKDYAAVVSDMRMPSMDGRTLLNHIAERHPSVARFILSGQSDLDDILGVVRTAHQFLAKPCDLDGLKRVLECAEAVGRLDDVTRRFNHRRLPSPKAQVDALRAAVEADQPNLDKITAIVQGDIAMTAQVLRLVNSGFFGRSIQTLNCGKAVVSLGAANLKALVEDVELFRPIEPFSVEGDAGVAKVNETANAAANANFVMEAQAKERLGFLGRLAACEADDKDLETDPERTGAHIRALWGLAPSFPNSAHATA